MVDKTKNNLDVEQFLDFLETNSVNSLPESLYEVQNLIKVEIENILWQNVLSQLLIKSKEYWLITISENLINDFEQEKEIKILWVDKEKLEIDLLEKAWAKMVFRWTVIDVYYDFENDAIEKTKWKTSFRIREKIWEDGKSTFYYTIKRKEKKDEDSSVMRVCYEKEFKINDIMLFIELLNHLWFKKTRAKKKDRVAYELWKIKFDIDSYEWIPPLLEIEAHTAKIAEFYIESLWLSSLEKSNWWSRSLYEKYDKTYKTFE